MKDTTNSQANYKKACKIYEDLVLREPDAYEPELALTLYDLGVYAFRYVSLSDADMLLSRAMEIRKKLVSKDPSTYDLDLAINERVVGFVKTVQKNYAEGEKDFMNSLGIYESLEAKYPNIYHLDATFACESLVYLYSTKLDSLKSTSFVKPNVDHFDIVENDLKAHWKFDTLYAHKLATYFNNRSWYLLFASKFREAEHCALNALAINPSSPIYKANLAHSLLFQNKFQEALKIYMEIKLQKSEQGEYFGQICIEDLTNLEKHGVINKKTATVKHALQN